MNVCQLHYGGSNAYIPPRWAAYRPLVSYTRLTQINLAKIGKPRSCVILIYCFGLLGKNTETRNMIHISAAPFARRGSSHSLLQNPLNGIFARQHTTLCKQTHAGIRAQWGGQVWHWVPALYVLFAQLRSHINLRADKKTGKPTRFPTTFPSERSFALFDNFAGLPTTQQLLLNLL